MTENAPFTPRRPHFRRHDPQPFVAQPDDVAIARFVHERRVARSTDICNFMSHRPRKKVLERLAVLYHNAVLDRPNAQRDYFAANASRPAYIYAIGDRGAQLLAEHDGIEMPRVSWRDKNRDMRRPFIHHRLMISDVLGALQTAIEAHPDLKFIPPAEILQRAPVVTQQHPNPWKIRAKVPTPVGTMIDGANVPDAVFGIDAITKRTRYYFMLEADRATMPVFRRTFSKTSLYGKYLTYWHAHRAGFHSRTFNIANFRVLTCTTTSQRAYNIADMIQKKIAPSNLFLTTDIKSLHEADDALALMWLSGKGERVRLAD